LPPLEYTIRKAHEWYTGHWMSSVSFVAMGNLKYSRENPAL
jgi:hypothetical protein